MTKQELIQAAMEIKEICRSNKCDSCPFWFIYGGYNYCAFECNAPTEIPAYWMVSEYDIKRREREE